MLTDESCYLHATDIIRPLALLFNFFFKLNVVPLHQNITKARILHVAFMKKDFFTLVCRNKTKALYRIIEFHCSLQHKPLLLFYDMSIIKNPSQLNEPTGAYTSDPQ